MVSVHECSGRQLECRLNGKRMFRMHRRFHKQFYQRVSMLRAEEQRLLKRQRVKAFMAQAHTLRLNAPEIVPVESSALEEIRALLTDIRAAQRLAEKTLAYVDNSFPMVPNFTKGLVSNV